MEGSGGGHGQFSFRPCIALRLAAAPIFLKVRNSSFSERSFGVSRQKPACRMMSGSLGRRFKKNIALTRVGSRPYSPAMFRRFIAGSFVTFWLLLLGIDVSGDVGLIQHYRGSETDRVVDCVLADYGQAANIRSNEVPILIAPTMAAHSAAFPPSFFCRVSTDQVYKEQLLSRQEIPIYKFHLVFLI